MQKALVQGERLVCHVKQQKESDLVTLWHVKKGHWLIVPGSSKRRQSRCWSFGDLIVPRPSDTMSKHAKKPCPGWEVGVFGEATKRERHGDNLTCKQNKSMLTSGHFNQDIAKYHLAFQICCWWVSLSHFLAIRVISQLHFLVPAMTLLLCSASLCSASCWLGRDSQIQCWWVSSSIFLAITVISMLYFLRLSVIVFTATFSSACNNIAALFHLFDWDCQIRCWWGSLNLFPCSDLTATFSSAECDLYSMATPRSKSLSWTELKASRNAAIQHAFTLPHVSNEDIAHIFDLRVHQVQNLRVKWRTRGDLTPVPLPGHPTSAVTVCTCHTFCRKVL